MGSTEKVEFNLGETIKKAKVTPPSLIKATPANIASDPDGVCTTSISNADDVMLMSSSQNKQIHSNHHILPKKDPPEGKTTALIAMMRGKPKDGYPRHHTNKHYEQNVVWVLLDSGSDSNLVFVNKDKPMLRMGCSRLSVKLE